MEESASVIPPKLLGHGETRWQLRGPHHVHVPGRNKTLLSIFGKLGHPPRVSSAQLVRKRNDVEPEVSIVTCSAVSIHMLMAMWVDVYKL